MILKFHKGNKAYPQPTDSQMQFDTLDRSISKIRIILLVQIGKEGWDCRSLTGIILSQEGDCPKNMVLQTSCRCLRQVDKYQTETALIYLNHSNGMILDKQLREQHHISVHEFTKTNNPPTKLKRFDRTKHLRLPKVNFYQLKVKYETLVVEEANAHRDLRTIAEKTMNSNIIIRTTDFSRRDLGITVDESERGEQPATYLSWLMNIAKESFGSLTIAELRKHDDVLCELFKKITYESEFGKYFSSHYDVKEVNSNIRKAFYEKRSFSTIEELIPQQASLLNITNFTNEIFTSYPESYYPEQGVVEKIIADDDNKLTMKPELMAAIRILEEEGNTDFAQTLRNQNISHPQKDRSFHYLPYRMDSAFEQTFLNEILPLDEIEKLNLEVYYNGDRSLTEFKIKCYQRTNGTWRYIGMYTPDFLIIQRKVQAIDKIIIVETKGEIYANDPTFKDKKLFVETEFVQQNNSKYGYDRFEYLYLEDITSKRERIELTRRKIKEFFGG